MPEQTEVEYLDGEFTILESEPSSIEELTGLIGEEAVVENVNANLRYRNKYPRVYRKVSEAIKGEHPRAVKEEKPLKDGTMRKVYVSEMDHIRDYLKTGNGAKDRLAELFKSIATSEPMYVKGERTGGGGKIPQSAIDSANQFFAAGEDRVEQVISKIEETVPGYKVGRDADGNPTPESVARGVVALNKHLVKQAQAQALGVLG